MAVFLLTIPEMHRKRFVCPYTLYCLNTLCMKFILSIHSPDSLENAIVPRVMRINEELLLDCDFRQVVSTAGVCQCLSSLSRTSAFHTGKSWKRALRLWERGSRNSASLEMIPLGDGWGPQAQCWGKSCSVVGDKRRTLMFMTFYLVALFNS